MIPMLPFPSPAIALAVIAVARLVLKPKSRLMSIVFTSPAISVIFLPYLSDALPQAMLVRHWQSENIAEVRPAHLAMSFSGTPKLSIISGR